MVYIQYPKPVVHTRPAKPTFHVFRVPRLSSSLRARTANVMAPCRLKSLFRPGRATFCGTLFVQPQPGQIPVVQQGRGLKNCMHRVVRSLFPVCWGRQRGFAHRLPLIAVIESSSDSSSALRLSFRRLAVENERTSASLRPVRRLGRKICV